jgi:hypothetical protein
MASDSHASDHQLARRLLDAFEREFWAGHHDRCRLLSAPLRVLHPAIESAHDAGALLGAVLQALEGGSRGPQ